MIHLNRLIRIFSVFPLLIACNQKDETICDEPKGKYIDCFTYEKGDLISYRSSLLDTAIKYGTALQFSSDGDTLVKAYYRNNKLLGSYYEYYSPNHPKLYVYFDSFNEDTMYSRKYNLDGSISSESNEEDLFYLDYYTTANSQRLAKDSILEIWSVIITPPNSRFIVDAFLVNVENSKDTIHPINEFYVPNQNNGIYSNEFKLQKIGKYKAFVNSELYDADKRKTLKKREIFDFSFPLSKN